jgi:plasmid stabilization system protein ParE
MGFNRLFSDEAKDDVNEILRNSKSDRQKQQFIETFDKHLDLLDEHPNMGQNAHGGYQIIRFVKLPFKFAYKIVKDNTLFVLGVFHKKRHPDYWKNRADDY